MNTTRTGMRTVLAAAAAGALIMGSAAGAMAAKPTAKANKDLYVHSVAIKGHSPLNVFDTFTEAPAEGQTVTPSTLRDLTVRISVRDKKSAYTVAGATVALQAYPKKVIGKTVKGLLTDPIEAPLTEVLPATSAKWDRLQGTVTLTSGQADELKGLLTKSPKLYLCISGVTVPGVADHSKKVQQRLGEAKGKAVRDCVKVVNIEPTK